MPLVLLLLLPTLAADWPCCVQQLVAAPGLLHLPVHDLRQGFDSGHKPDVWSSSSSSSTGMSVSVQLLHEEHGMLVMEGLHGVFSA